MFFSIHYSPEASQPVQYAAEELTRCMRNAGIAEGPDGLQITLNEHAPELPGGAFRRIVSSTEITIESSEACGIIYGSYAFLEALGFRFLAPDCEVVPPQLPALPNGITEERPAFRSRELFWREAMDGAFAVRLRLNSTRSSITPRQGGKMMFYNFSHSFNALVPVEKWFSTHPEYFSMINGQRISEKTQLCLSNPDVLKLCIEGVKQWARDNPACNIFSVSMNDWYNACECPACRAVDEQEESQAGSVIRFVNKVAEEVEKEFPKAQIHTFAYLYCRKPPKLTKPRHNVIVRLCSIECCFSHPIRECNRERGGIDVQNGSAINFSDAPVTESRFIRDLKAWSGICENLFIWDYTTNYANYLLPFPNLNVLQENLRLFRDYGVKGVFEQGNFAHGRTSALAQLKIYLLSKLLWNPDDDAAGLTEEFIRGYYGSAAQPMLEYVRLWQNAAGEHHVGIYDMPDSPWLNDKLLARASGLLQDALELAKGTNAYERVQREALSVRYAVLTREETTVPGHAERVDAFAADARRLGITELFQRKDFDASVELMKTLRYVSNRRNVPSISYPI